MFYITRKNIKRTGLLHLWCSCFYDNIKLLFSFPPLLVLLTVYTFSCFTGQCTVDTPKSRTRMKTSILQLWSIHSKKTQDFMIWIVIVVFQVWLPQIYFWLTIQGNPTCLGKQRESEVRFHQPQSQVPELMREILDKMDSWWLWPSVGKL